MMKTEKTTITKLKCFFDIDKEFAYINEMNKKGWKLLYIKWGMFMTFEKTEPDEYFTIMHTESKENMSKVIAFAAQCGYEIVPHTVDGFGEVLYLTGKRSRVSKEFVSDNNDKINMYQRLNKKLFALTIVYIILDLFLVALTTANLFLASHKGYSPFLIGNAAFTGVVAIFIIGLTFKLIFMSRKYKRKIKEIETDSMIFE